ncbi:MAG: hypothetical protein E6Z24_09260, partial [Dialister sp.]|nr:hypothetical protein [Dialister sp.]
MTVSVRAVHIVVVVLPVLCASVIRRIDVDAIYHLCIQILQQLQRMVIIRLNQRMPKAAIRSVLHAIQR